MPGSARSSVCVRLTVTCPRLIHVLAVKGEDLASAEPGPCGQDDRGAVDRRHGVDECRNLQGCGYGSALGSWCASAREVTWVPGEDFVSYGCVEDRTEESIGLRDGGASSGAP